MRWASWATMAILAGCALGVTPAQADHASVLVVPGKPGVPVIINGYDASWGIVEGDWGLHRPGWVSPTVTYPYRVIFPYGAQRGYFPATGMRPRVGRYEIVPPQNRLLPEPAESFHRFWSSESGLINPVIEYPAYNPPPVILAPKLDPPSLSRSSPTPSLRSLD